MPDAPGLTWSKTQPNRARSLADARLQLHYAAQFGAALGISYLTPQTDDGHTNLGWNATLGSLKSRAVPGRDGSVAIEVRVRDLTLILMHEGTVQDEIELHGSTVEATLERVRISLGGLGTDPLRYSLARHYEIPSHPVATGAPFNAVDAPAFDELARWFGNAALALDEVRHDRPDVSQVRIWPHHFDVATLVTYPGGGSTGAGLVPGDDFYDEPYFYVNAYPQPRPEQATGELAGGGEWHTRDWVGAVLPGSRIEGDAVRQERQVRAFLGSALAACRKLVGG